MQKRQAIWDIFNRIQARANLIIGENKEDLEFVNKLREDCYWLAAFTADELYPRHEGDGATRVRTF